MMNQVKFLNIFRSMNRVRLLFILVLFFCVNHTLQAQYDSSFDMEGYLTGKWHNYKWEGGIAGQTYIYPDSVRYETIFYRDTLNNSYPDSLNACSFYNDSLIVAGLSDLMYRDSVPIQSAWVLGVNLRIDIIDSAEFVLSTLGGADIPQQFYKKVDAIARTECVANLTTGVGFVACCQQQEYFDLILNEDKSIVQVNFKNNSSGLVYLLSINGAVITEEEISNTTQMGFAIDNLSTGLYFILFQSKEIGISSSKIFIK